MYQVKIIQIETMVGKKKGRIEIQPRVKSNIL
jgi:hypothetical protein